MLGLKLDHATIDSADLEASVAFYKHFLDLSSGWRPDFGFPGAWLYPLGSDYAIIHLIGRTSPEEGGRFNHIAFRGTDLPAYLRKVEASGAWFEATPVPVPGKSFTQVQHLDPNGVRIEVLFEEALGQDRVVSKILYPKRTGITAVRL